MMNDRDVLRRVLADVQQSKSKRVVYLEGKDDVPMLFALLGAQVPTVPGISEHEGLSIVGLSADDASGGVAVQRHVELARQRGLTVFGIVDGDGAPLCDLCAAFDEPCAGPLFRWKAYCIENLIAQTGWPSSWGEEPSWSEVLLLYGAYVALNRLHREVGATLRTLRLDRFQNPDGRRTLLTTAEIAAVLEQDKHLLTEYDAAARFRDEVAAFESIVASDLRAAHALLNGKWLFRHFARERTGRSAESCRREWLEHVTTAGGSEEIKHFWARLAALR